MKGPTSTPGGRHRDEPHKKPWSHQRELEGMKGRPVRVRLRGAAGEGSRYKLLQADQFALLLENGINKPILVFKHAIDTIYAE